MVPIFSRLGFTRGWSSQFPRPTCFPSEAENLSRDGVGGGAISTPQSLWKKRGWEPFVTNNQCDVLYLEVVVAPNPLLHRFAAHSCEEMEVF